MSEPLLRDRRTAFPHLPFLALYLFFSLEAGAATKTWTGLGFDVFWSTPNNWSPPGAPASGDDVVFPTGAVPLSSLYDYFVVPNTITFQQGGFVVTDNVGFVGIGPNGTIAMTAGSGTATILGQVAPAGSLATFAVSGGATLSFSKVATAIAVQKTDAGTLVLTSSSPFLNGTMTVTQGVLEIQNGLALGPGGAGNSTIVQSGATLRLQGSLNVPVGLTLAGTGIGGAGALHALAGTSAFGAGVSLSADTTIAVDAGTLTLAGNVSGPGALTKTGAGSLVLTAANSYAGPTQVDSGLLAVQNGGGLGMNPSATVASGATLELDGSAASFTLAKSLTLTGNGAGGQGTLWNLAGDNAIAGSVILQAGPVVLRTDGSGTLALLSDVGGAAGLTKIGTGTLRLGGGVPNSYGGATMLGAGTLVLDHTAAGGNAVPGPLVIGDGTGAPGSKHVLLLFGNQIADSSAVTIDTDGLLDLGPHAETIGSLTMTGGGVSMATGGTLTLLGNVGKPSGSSTATVGGSMGTLILPATRTFDTSGTGVPDLQIDAAVLGAGGIVKTGNGTLQLSRDNTLAGTATIQAGTLLLLTPNGLGDAAFGTTVNFGGSLNLGFSSTFAEPLSLSGPGSDAPQGALHAELTATATGPIDLPMGAIVFAQSGATLTLGGAVTGLGDLAKYGGGTLVLSANNTYAGPTLANQGTLIVNGNQPSGEFYLNAGTLGGVGTIGPLLASFGTLSPGQSPGILGTGNLALLPNSTFAVELNGTTAGTQYDQVNVTGSVDLGGAALSVTLGYAPAMGDAYTIIANDGMDAVTSTFASLPEGAAFASGSTVFSITYAGGTGNDVVLTMLCDDAGAPTVTAPSSATVTQTTCE